MIYNIDSFVREIPVSKSKEKSDIIACLLVLGVRKYAEDDLLDTLSIMQDILFLGDWNVIYEWELMEKALFLSMYAKGINNNKNENKLYVREYKEKLFKILKIKKSYYGGFFSSWSKKEINIKIKNDILYRLKGGVLNEIREDLVFYKKRGENFLFILEIEKILELIYLYYMNGLDLRVEIDNAKKDLLKLIETNSVLPPYCDFEI